MHKIGTIFKLNVKPSFCEKEGEIAGIFAGDGSQYFHPKRYHYEVNVHFGGKNYDYAIYVKELFESFFKKKFNLKWEKDKTILRLKTYSKEIFYFFKKHHLSYEPKFKHCSVKLKSEKFSQEFKIGFLRGIFDTDGCLYKNSVEKRVRLTFNTTSKNLIKQISDMLTELDIKHGIYIRKPKGILRKKSLYIASIWKESVTKFINTIHPFKAK